MLIARTETRTIFSDKRFYVRFKKKLMVIVLITFEIKTLNLYTYSNKTAIEIINDVYYNYPNADFILFGDFNIPSAISTNTKKFFSRTFLS
ncbi:Uncharacterized protein FWK35_00022362 [Aphis craccivora]|uniref:Endonuclease/exonuclease/phosphatase domain-containing protein n=1 Tax=Aphis craccivora TaxID=307492 RepID=A0A6G0W1S2_APHCR|nr:Uncharacterized protein FWK35_00022362 [Aphis craccivora]